MFAYTIAITLITALLALLEPDEEEGGDDEVEKDVEEEGSMDGQNYDPPLESNTSSSIEIDNVHNNSYTQLANNQPPLVDYSDNIPMQLNSNTYTHTNISPTQHTHTHINRKHTNNTLTRIHTHTHIIIHKHHINLLLLAGRLIVGWAWEQLFTYTLMTIVLYILKNIIYNIYLRTCIKIIVSIIMIIFATYIKLYNINNKNSIIT